LQNAKKCACQLELGRIFHRAVRKLCYAVAGLHFEFKIQDGYVVEMQFK